MQNYGTVKEEQIINIISLLNFIKMKFKKHLKILKIGLFIIILSWLIKTFIVAYYNFLYPRPKDVINVEETLMIFSNGYPEYGIEKEDIEIIKAAYYPSRGITEYYYFKIRLLATLNWERFLFNP